LPDPNPVFRKNPCQVPEVDHILAEDPEQPPAFNPTASSSQALGIGRIPLPEELCTVIAMYLPTTDVLRARLASRSFWSVFYNQQFWKSRFGASADRSWLFEARNISSLRDWRWLYRRTNVVHIGPGLRNRQRIWRLLQGLLDISALVWNELPPVLPAMWSPDIVIRATDRRVDSTGGFCRDQHAANRTLDNGCRQFRSQRIAVPDNLARLSVYALAFGDREYITGMTLTAVAGDTIRLGYRSSSEHSVELSQLWGFRLAMGSRGLQALKCITGPGGLEAPWLGSLEDVPRTERLAAMERVVGLEVGIDVSASYIFITLGGKEAHVLTNTNTELQDSQHRCVYPIAATPGRFAPPRKQVEKFRGVVPYRPTTPPLLERSVISSHRLLCRHWISATILVPFWRSRRKVPSTPGRHFGGVFRLSTEYPLLLRQRCANRASILWSPGRQGG
jgi:hypothetical protein